MVLSNKETTVSYRCPVCGSTVTSIVGIFSLTADMIRLKCPCGGSHMEIVYTKDKKLRLTVPCLLCPKPHNFLVSSSMFFERDLFALPCSYSGIDVCYIGRQDKVADAMEESGKELLRMLGDTSLDRLARARDSERHELTDPQVLEIVLYVIHDLADEGKVKCRCGDGCGDYDVEIDDDHLTVRCKDCGAAAVIGTASVTAANDFLSCDELILR